MRWRSKLRAWGCWNPMRCRQCCGVETRLLQGAHRHAEFDLRKNVLGIGDVLATVNLLETGDLKRYAEVGNFASDARPTHWPPS